MQSRLCCGGLGLVHVSRSVGHAGKVADGMERNRFTGTSVAVYGPVNMNRGVYTVTCDGISTEYV